MNQEDDRFIKNSETVEIIGEELGFIIIGFDPDWLVHFKYSHRYDESDDIPDRVMESLARLMKLPWENEYNSPLSSSVIERAMYQADKERRAYQMACYCCMTGGDLIKRYYEMFDDILRVK